MDLHVTRDQRLVYSVSQAKLVRSNNFREGAFLKVLFGDPDQSVIPG